MNKREHRKHEIISSPGVSVETGAEPYRAEDMGKISAVDEMESERQRGRLMQQISESHVPEPRIEKQEIVNRLREKAVKPDKPTLKNLLDWMKRTAVGQRYDTRQASEIYDKFARYEFGREAEAKEIALALLKNIPAHPYDALICERAAGTGIVTEALVAAGFKVRASDISHTQLDLLASRLSGVETVIEDINGPMKGVEDCTVDGVLEIAADRFMTADGQTLFVKEAHRVLKPGGVLVWSASPFEFIGKLRHGLDWKPGKKEISDLLINHEFEIISDKLRIYKWNFSGVAYLIIAQKKSKAD